MAPKAAAVREVEVEGIRKEMVGYDLTLDLFPELQPFWDVLEDFRKTGQSSSGSLKLPRLHRKLVWKLTTRPNIDSTAVLQHTGKSA